MSITTEEGLYLQNFGVLGHLWSQNDVIIKEEQYWW